MIYRNNLKNDRELLWATGFLVPATSAIDKSKLCEFFDVSKQTVNRWISSGLPRYARQQLLMIAGNALLPANWRGIAITSEGLFLESGHKIPLHTLRFLPFILRHVDWSKVPSIAKASH